MTVSRMLAADGSAANLLIRLLVGGVFFLEGIKKFLFIAGAGPLSADGRILHSRH